MAACHVAFKVGGLVKEENNEEEDEVEYLVIERHGCAVSVHLIDLSGDSTHTGIQL